MAKLQAIEKDGEITGYFFECPGCYGHFLTVRPHVAQNGASWEFNGDLEKPTFSPSVLSRYEFSETGRTPIVCHSFITDGKIRFLSDCSHQFAGQIVDMIELDD